MRRSAVARRAALQFIGVALEGEMRGRRPDLSEAVHFELLSRFSLRKPAKPFPLFPDFSCRSARSVTAFRSSHTARAPSSSGFSRFMRLWKSLWSQPSWTRMEVTGFR